MLLNDKQQPAPASFFPFSKGEEGGVRMAAKLKGKEDTEVGRACIHGSDGYVVCGF